MPYIDFTKFDKSTIKGVIVEGLKSVPVIGSVLSYIASLFGIRGTTQHLNDPESQPLAQELARSTMQFFERQFPAQDLNVLGLAFLDRYFAWWNTQGKGNEDYYGAYRVRQQWIRDTTPDKMWYALYFTYQMCIRSWDAERLNELGRGYDMFMIDTGKITDTLSDAAADLVKSGTLRPAPDSIFRNLNAPLLPADPKVLTAAAVLGGLVFFGRKLL